MAWYQHDLEKQERVFIVDLSANISPHHWINFLQDEGLTGHYCFDLEEITFTYKFWFTDIATATIFKLRFG